MAQADDTGALTKPGETGMSDRSTPWLVHRAVTSLAVVVVTLVALGVPGAAPVSGQSRSDPAVLEVSQRTSCAGSVDSVLTNLDGAIADELETLQAEHESTDGFRAVVYDGRDFTIVVAEQSLASWRKRVAASDARIAPSCVDDDLLEAASRALRALEYGPGDFASAGYDALVDAVVVKTTFETQDVIHAFEAAMPDGRPAAIVAEAREDGGLRIVKDDRGDASRRSRNAQGCWANDHKRQTTLNTYDATVVTQ